MPQSKDIYQMLGKRQPGSQHPETERKSTATSTGGISNFKASVPAKVASSSRVPDSAKEAIIKRNPFVSNPLLLPNSNFKQNQVLQNLKSVRAQIVKDSKNQKDSGTTTERASPELPKNLHSAPKVILQDSSKVIETGDPMIAESVDEESFARLSQMADELAELDQTKILSSLNRLGSERTNLLLSPQRMLLRSGSTKEFTSVQAVIQFSTTGVNSKLSKPSDSKQNPQNGAKNPSPAPKAASKSSAIPHQGDLQLKNLHRNDEGRKIQNNTKNHDEFDNKVSNLTNSKAPNKGSNKISKTPTSKIAKDAQNSKSTPKGVRAKSLQTKTDKLSQLSSDLSKQQNNRRRSASKSKDYKPDAPANLKKGPSGLRIQLPPTTLERLPEYPDDELCQSTVDQKQEPETYQGNQILEQAQKLSLDGSSANKTFAKIILWHQTGASVFSVVRDAQKLIGSTSIAPEGSKETKRAVKSRAGHERTKTTGPKLRSSTRSKSPLPSREQKHPSPRLRTAASPEPKSQTQSQAPQLVGAFAGKPAKVNRTSDAPQAPQQQQPRATAHMHEQLDQQRGEWEAAAFEAARRAQVRGRQQHERAQGLFVGRALPGALAGLSSARARKLQVRLGFA